MICSKNQTSNVSVIFGNNLIVADVIINDDMAQIIFSATVKNRNNRGFDFSYLNSPRDAR